MSMQSTGQQSPHPGAESLPGYSDPGQQYSQAVNIPEWLRQQPEAFSGPPSHLSTGPATSDFTPRHSGPNYGDEAGTISMGHVPASSTAPSSGFALPSHATMPRQQYGMPSLPPQAPLSSQTGADTPYGSIRHPPASLPSLSQGISLPHGVTQPPLPIGPTSLSSTNSGDLKGGYDADFVMPLDDKNKCSICLLALRNPVQTQCGHRFCKDCLEPIRRLVHHIAAKLCVASTFALARKHPVN